MVDTADSSVKLSIKNGELWCGDCLDLMRDIPSGSVDMILCDLPYGTTACSWDSVIPFAPLWSEYWRIAKPNAAVVLTASQPFTSALIMSQIDRFKYEWIWEKSRPTDFPNVNNKPMKKHENVLIFSIGTTANGSSRKMPYNPQGLIAKERKVSRTSRGGFQGERPNQTNNYVSSFTNFPVSVLSVPSEGSTIHPTQKPVALFEYLIRTYTDPGQVVLDNCIGSGTTAIACENTGRRWIGIERDLTYCMSAWQRIMDHQPSSVRTTM